MDESGKFPIVGIGASAGGIEALEGFFRGLPSAPGVAIVIVTHLSPERDSRLHEVVSRYTAMPIVIISDGIAVEADHVYVLPSDMLLGMLGGKLQMRPQAPGRRERKPIDIFFTALAADQGPLAIGIVLSGGDGDGTLGVKAIKERGGLTMAQVADGFGPGYPDMPNSAIATGLVDFAIPVDSMGDKLAGFARSMALPEPPIDESPQTVEQAAPAIYALLRNRIGHDFSGYKSNTFMRRVRRRMQVNQITTMAAYVERLGQDPQEIGALFRDLLINVTAFFRDDEAFRSVAAQVIPRLFEGRGARDTVRVWVPGCATGEEVFSIAILLREHMDTLDAVPRVQVFATDIDERALLVARAGRYPDALLEAVTPERRRRFFVPDGASSIVSKDVRELCIFSPHSVIRDPPFSRIDLVSCRNLLIYLGVDVQSQVIPTFHYALRPNGYLFLGSAENVSAFDDLFTPVDKRHRIFRRRSDVSPSVRLPAVIGALRAGPFGDAGVRGTPLGAIAVRQVAESHVLERYAPAHVLVNEDGEVVYYSARTGKYLEAPVGAPTRQLLTMARRGLRLDLRTVFREAVETGRIARRIGIRVEDDNGRFLTVDLIVEPVPRLHGTEALFLVLFDDQEPASGGSADFASSADPGAATVQLERELRETRDRMQSVIEEYETALEELKSSNEELVSVNEEMQSTNEELEASKEELQSVNEELHTVNAELTGKVEALDQANSDLQNLFDSTDVATVFLDKNLTIRSFTPAVRRVFNVLRTDRGRPITDLTSRFNLPDFASDISRVFDEQEPIERRAENDDGTAQFLVRLAPYRDTDQRVQGVVVTFVEVTGLIRAEARQLVLIAELQHRTRNLLALVQSVARQSFEELPALTDFETRLAALSRVQGLIGRSESDRIDLRDIVRMELEALGGRGNGRTTVSGGSVLLDVEHVQTLGLALHELTTNAVKYGALKGESGRLEVDWTTIANDDDVPRLAIEWRESGLAEPPDGSRRGFGRQLIERALAHTLRAETALTFGQDSVLCRIVLPLPRPRR